MRRAGAAAVGAPHQKVTAPVSWVRGSAVPSPRMANCVACGWNLPFPFGGDCRESFFVPEMWSDVTRPPTNPGVFPGHLYDCFSVLFRTAFIIVNPRVNPDKTTKLTYLLEKGHDSGCSWRTRWVRVEIVEPRRVL